MKPTLLTFFLFSFVMSLPADHIELPCDYGDIDGINFSIKPTLAFEEITIQFNNIQRNVKVEILDLTGRRVYTDNFYDTDQIALNVSTLKRSPYFVRVTIDDKVKTKRFVKR